MAADLFEIGRAWSNVARSAYRSLRETVFGSRGGDPAAPQLTAVRGAGTASESLRRAGDALRKAFEKLSTQTRPVYATTLYSGLSSSAMLNGTSARVARVEGYSRLATTLQVNTRTSTVRSSSSALGLDVTSAESVATIQSTAEMNARFETAYTSSLTFSGSGLASSSTANLTGTYTGVNTAANATSLTVKMRNNDLTMNETVATAVKFDVMNQSSTVLFSFEGNLVSGQQVYLGDDIGLSLSFTSGALRNNHQATTALTQTQTPITVDANAAFNAGISTRPRFESGAVVSAGTFTVNGATITVAANDTVNGVISKINSSAAGVTASLATDRITLTSNSYSEDAIVLANDTTGFVAATKLSGATTVVGNIRDDQQVFSKTT